MIKPTKTIFFVLILASLGLGACGKEKTPEDNPSPSSSPSTNVPKSEGSHKNAFAMGTDTGKWLASHLPSR